MNKKEYFDKMSDVWDAHFYTSDVIKKLHYLVAQFGLTKGAIILDVGTGTGVLMPLLLECVGSQGSITAVDFSARMIQRARDKFRGRANLNFYNASVDNLPFKISCFDSVICFGAFPHFEDKKKALSEMCRVLRGGGNLFVAHALGSKKLMEHHKGTLPVSADVLPEEPEMVKMMRGAGFNNISIVDEVHYYICKGEKIDA